MYQYIGKERAWLKRRSRVSLRSTRATTLVMPAHVAGIHVFWVGVRPSKDVDGRNKFGHDNVDAQFLPRLRGRVGRGPAASRLAQVAILAPSRVASAYVLRVSADR